MSDNKNDIYSDNGIMRQRLLNNYATNTQGEKKADWEFQQGIETLKLDQMKILKLKKK